jgi:hypothetical protein
MTLQAANNRALFRLTFHPPIMVSVIAPLQENNQSSNQTQQTNGETDRRPVPVVQAS